MHITLLSTCFTGLHVYHEYMHIVPGNLNVLYCVINYRTHILPSEMLKGEEISTLESTNYDTTSEDRHFTH